MSKGIPRRPLVLVGFLVNLIAGDDKHQQDSPLPKALRADLEATKASLESLNGRVTVSRGQYRQDSADRRDYINTAATLAEKFRDAIFLQHGHKDEVLVDYGLAPRRKARKSGSAAASPESASSRAAKKLERAQVRASRAQARFEKAQAYLAKSQALLVRRKAEVAVAAPVAPHEPNPSSEPAPPSGAK